MKQWCIAADPDHDDDTSGAVVLLCPPCGAPPVRCDRGDVLDGAAAPGAPRLHFACDQCPARAVLPFDQRDGCTLLDFQATSDSDPATSAPATRPPSKRRTPRTRRAASTTSAAADDPARLMWATDPHVTPDVLDTLMAIERQHVPLDVLDDMVARDRVEFDHIMAYLPPLD